MKQLATLFILILCIGFSPAQNVYFNEIRANDEGTDDAEFIELVGPAGTDLSGWTITHYNGSGGAIVFSFTFPAGAIIPDDGFTDKNGMPLGFVVIRNGEHSVPNADFEWGTIGLQNGPDGIELLNAANLRIQALTWNGLGDLSGGDPPWRNIGSDSNTDNSLSAPDSVQEIFKKNWSLENATPGALNNGQTTGDISLPVQLSDFKAVGGDNIVILSWRTASEVDHLGFLIERATSENGSFRQIASYKTDDNLRGTGNTSQERLYAYTDKTVINGVVYWYRLVDVDIDGVYTVHTPVSATPNAGVHPVDTPGDGIQPKSFNLFQNYPNPFNPFTHIRFDIPNMPAGYTHVCLNIYDMSGKKIKTLLEAPLSSGRYQVYWDSRNSDGVLLASGIYFYEFISDKFRAVRRMVLIR
jgi:hypothetical protein